MNTHLQPVDRQRLAQPTYALQNYAFLCSDVVDFTRMTLRLGDLAALQVMQRVNRMIREISRASDGCEWELRGDGFLFTHDRADNALAAAIAIQRGMAGLREACLEYRLAVRIAVHVGQVYHADARLFGRHLILAFRLVDCACPDGIVISDAARRTLSSTDGLRFERRVAERLQGFKQRTAYSAVLPTGATSAADAGSRWPTASIPHVDVIGRRSRTPRSSVSSTFCCRR